jgi:hypothetical protein
MNARITGLRNLWEPSREFRGQATQKPNYLTSVIVPKTKGHWSQEPSLMEFAQACQQLYTKAMQPNGIPFDRVTWPVKDGDLPPDVGRPVIEWARGHWFIGGSSTTPINVEMVQGGAAVKLMNRAGVKPGDYVSISGALAVKTNDNFGVKMYVNNVLFMAPGEEIAIGNSESGAQMMAKAQAQGLNVQGFAPAHAAAGGFGNGQSFNSSGNVVPFQQPQQQTGVGDFGGGGFAPAPAQPPGNFSGSFQGLPPSGFTPPR